MSEIKSLGKASLIYGAGTVLGKLASFIMLPIYTRHLTPADYGTLELLTMTVDVVAMITGLGVSAGVFKFFAEAPDQSTRNRVVSTASIANSALALLTALVGLFAAPQLSLLVFGEVAQASLFRILFAVYFLQASNVVPFFLIRALQKPTLFITVNFVDLLAKLALNIYMVVFLQMGIRGILLGTLISTSFKTLFLIGYSIRQVGFGFSPPIARQLAVFGMPMVVWMIGSFILTFSDRYFLNHFAGKAEVGIYALAYKFSFIFLEFGLAPFKLVWDPQRFEFAKRPDGAAIFRRTFLYLNIGLTVIGLGILLSVRDFLTIAADPAFRRAYEVVPYLLLGAMFQAWTEFCDFGLHKNSKTSLHAAASCAAIVGALILNFLLIPRYGVLGAAWAATGAFGIRFALIYHWSQAQYRVEYDWVRVGRLVAITAAVVVAHETMDGLPVGVSIGVSLALLTAGLTCIYFGVLTAEDRSQLRGFVSSRLPRSLLLRPR